MWPPLIRALRYPACYPHDVEKLEILETHISWVILTGAFAYKIKKPVKLPFLDFSKLSERRRFCEVEVDVNRRLAGDYYVGVVPIGGSVEAPRIGTRPAIEFAVKMRQFEQSRRLDRMVAARRVSPDQIRRFARTIAEFHRRGASVAPPDPEDAARASLDNIAELESFDGKGGSRGRIARLRDWTREQSRGVSALAHRRSAAGAYRDCHGDLHLENVFVDDDGELIAFDALEFDAARREIDTAAELAFFTMDLIAHERRDLAFSFVSEYCEQTGDYEGLELLRYYMVYCALVRAKVAAIKAGERRELSPSPAVERYIGVAEELTAPRAPLLLITHGLSASGKTYASTRLVPALEAIRLRSDLERKRLAGLAALEQSQSPPGGGIYTAEWSRRTYERLEQIAEVVLRNGFNCIVDAAFLERTPRDRFRALADAIGARFAILHCDTDEPTLRARIRDRAAARADASEAGEPVLDRQLREREPLNEDEGSYVQRCEAGNEDFDALAAALLDRGPAA